ncbi:hypothetical protein ACFE04_021846 [Oxalis oulophora]
MDFNGWSDRVLGYRSGQQLCVVTVLLRKVAGEGLRERVRCGGGCDGVDRKSKGGGLYRWHEGRWERVDFNGWSDRVLGYTSGQQLCVVTVLLRKVAGEGLR